MHPPGRNSRRWSITEAAVVFALTVYVAWPFLRDRRLVAGFDTIAYAGPNLALTFEGYRRLSLVHWNEDIFGGVPHLANPQAGVLYLVKFPFAWMDPHRALCLLVALHIGILAVGTLVLARRVLRLPPPGGALATVAILGSGMVATKSLQFEQILVVAWVPWVMLAIDEVLRPGATIVAAIGLAVAEAALLTAGHPQVVFIVAPLLAAWALGRALDRRSLTPRLLMLPLVGSVAGVLLAAPQLLATLHLVARAAVGADDPASVATPGHSVYPSLLPASLLGDAFSSSSGAASNGFENISHVGVVVAVLALAGVVVGLGSRSVRWTTAAASVTAASTLVLSLGPRTPIFRGAFAVVPGFSFARVPARWSVAATFAIVVLAGVAAPRLAATAELRRRVRSVVVVAAGAGLLAAAAIAVLRVPGGATAAAWTATALVAITALVALARRPDLLGPVIAVLVVLVSVEAIALQRFAPTRTVGRSEPVPELAGALVERLQSRPERTIALTFDRFDDPRYLVSTLRPNVNVFFDIRSIDGYDGGIQVTRRWIREMAPLVAGPVNRDLTLRAQVKLPLSPERYADLGVRWALVETAAIPASVSVPGWRGPRLSEGSVELWENPAYHGSAWRQTDDEIEPLAVARRQDALHVRLDGVRGRVVLAEQYDEGWRATIGGRPVETDVYDGFNLAVDVPGGARTLDLRYTTPGFSVGLLASGAGVIMLVAAGVGERIRRSRAAPRTISDLMEHAT